MKPVHYKLLFGYNEPTWWAVADTFRAYYGPPKIVVDGVRSPASSAVNRVISAISDSFIPRGLLEAE